MNFPTKRAAFFLLQEYLGKSPELVSRTALIFITFTSK